MRPAPTSPSMPSQPPAAAPTMPTSPWHSPVPYLFGGLAAMLGLIALALLILACSYWKLNSYLANSGDSSASSSADPDAAAGADGSKSPAFAAAASPAAFAGLVAVVMAGEKTPTFLAAPVVHRVVDGAPAVAPEAAGVGSATETEEGQESSGKAGAGDSGGGALVGEAERHRQRDHV